VEICFDASASDLGRAPARVGPAVDPVSIETSKLVARGSKKFNRNVRYRGAMPIVAKIFLIILHWCEPFPLIVSSDFVFNHMRQAVAD
jgi:hypothetical protein